jgi:type IV secretory pathway VirB2 component (pilin)
MPPASEIAAESLANSWKNFPPQLLRSALPSLSDEKSREYPLAGKANEREPMQTILPMKLPRFRRLRLYARKLALPSLMFLAALPVYAQSSGSDPWDNAVTVLKTAFTGTIATCLSLVAIVVGGLMFAYGEGQSKKTIAGIVFGVGMAIGAVNFMSWLFPS